MIIARRTLSSSFSPTSKLNTLLLPLSSSRLPRNHSSLLKPQNPHHSHLHHNPSSLSLPFFPHFFSSKPTTSAPPPSPSLTRDGNYDDATPPMTVCPGCGVHMQDSNPKHPGFFTRPSVKCLDYKSNRYLELISSDSEFPYSIKRGLISEPQSPNPNPDTSSSQAVQKPPVVCARCHSLRHYGRVKDPTVENLLPEFDFDHTVGRRLVSSSGARSVVLLVADAVDFDGSFPKRVAKLVSDVIDDKFNAWKKGKSGNVPRIVLVVTKIDLLPSSMVSPTRFEHWVRRRAREGGASVIKKVHFVSSVKNWGMKSLVEDVIELAGTRGNVWAIGAQNAGKSTLINAMAKCKGDGGGQAPSYLTEAPVPGTTLGILRVEGVLPGQAKLFDTPGLLNPQQITTRLTRDEQKLVHVSKELKPRTYRIKEGHSVHIGGLMRLDVEKLSVDSVYVTVWASPYVPLHMGKTDNSCSMVKDHFGCQLQPPIGKERVQELGKWVRYEFRVTGNSWDSSSVDVAAAGLGWFSVGLKGDAVLGVWTYEGVDVVLRDPLIPYRSQTFEVAGFTVSKIVSKADQALNKPQNQSEKKKKQSYQKVAS